MYLLDKNNYNLIIQTVLVPFYRGAVVFTLIIEYKEKGEKFSSPFIEERLYFRKTETHLALAGLFSSPFIEERLYFMEPHNKSLPKLGVLVPFYRGAVVFEKHESDPVTAKS